MAAAMNGAAQPSWRQLSGYRLAWLRPDLLAGMAVAAYLIPQCLAYGELAGLDPVRGLWAGLIQSVSQARWPELPASGSLCGLAPSLCAKPALLQPI
jgi:hypothetical protein